MNIVDRITIFTYSSMLKVETRTSTPDTVTVLTRGIGERKWRSETMTVAAAREVTSGCPIVHQKAQRFVVEENGCRYQVTSR